MSAGLAKSGKFAVPGVKRKANRHHFSDVLESEVRVGHQDNRFYRAAYPLQLDVHYRLVSAGTRAPVWGSGRTITLGSHEIVFAGDESMPANASVQLSVCWPVLLDNRIRLQLVIEGRVTRVEGGAVTVRIGKYHFRTRGPAAASERRAGAMVAFQAVAGPVSLAAHA